MHDMTDPTDKPDVRISTWSRGEIAAALTCLALLLLVAFLAGDQPYDLSTRWR